MNRIEGRTVLVTGSTAGIGEACARVFARDGARVILVGRRQERLDALATELASTDAADVLTFALDVRIRDAVSALRDELAARNALPDVLINNAGKARGLDPVHEGDLDDWDEMIDTNVKGLLYFTRAFVPSMVENDFGHVVNIGSTAGRWTYPKGAVYCGTKFSVKAITEGLALDLVGTKVRVSSVDPGLVDTEFSEVRFHGDTDRAKTVYQGYEPLHAEDIADAVRYVVNAPPHVDVFNMTILPTAQRHSMVVHRENG